MRYPLDELYADEVMFSIEKHGELRGNLEARLLELLRESELSLHPN